MFRHILVCSDGSEHAIEAARLSALMAKTFNASLTVLYVCQAPVISEPFPGAPLLDVALWYRYACDMYRAAMERTLPVIQAVGAPFEVAQEVGRSDEAIAQYADSHGVDLIVVGSRGLQADGAVQLGCTSFGVIHRARCQVLVVKWTDAFISYARTHTRLCAYKMHVHGPLTSRSFADSGQALRTGLPCGLAASEGHLARSASQTGVSCPRKLSPIRTYQWVLVITSAALFALWEIGDHLWLMQAPMRLQHTLHILGTILLLILASAAVFNMILRFERALHRMNAALQAANAELRRLEATRDKELLK